MGYDSYLYHHGVVGMKWGVRRYQNKDGTLTPSGKKRYLGADGKLNKLGQKEVGATYKSDGEKSKRASDMTDNELRDSITRLRMEDEYKRLMKSVNPPKEKVFNGKKFVAEILQTTGKKIASDVLTYYVGTTINDLFDAKVVNLKGENNDNKDKKKEEQK